MTDNQNTAVRDWYTRARVRVLTETTVSADYYESRTFRAGDELVMIQWGRGGRDVDRESWWTSTDIDNASILPASAVEVLRVLDERDPMVADCGAKKPPPRYTYNVCSRDQGHDGDHSDPYGAEWPREPR